MRFYQGVFRGFLAQFRTVGWVFLHSNSHVFSLRVTDVTAKKHNFSGNTRAHVRARNEARTHKQRCTRERQEMKETMYT